METKPIKILLVDDDAHIRELINDILVTEKYEVKHAEDGKNAQSYLALEDFNIIISDVRMPQMNGIELLHFVKRVKPTPFILMTAFSDISEAQEAYNLGATEFLSKPFNKNELLDAIKKCLAPSKPAQNELATDDQYCKINIDEFVSGTILQFDLFVRLSDTKYIKIASKNQHIEIGRVLSYKSKGVNVLYMRKADFSTYVGFSLNLLSAAEKLSVSKEKKVQLLKHTAEVILEKAFVVGVDKDVFSNARNTLESTISIISEHPDLYEFLNVLNSHSDSLYTHSVGVSLYSTIIAQEVGWGSSASLFKVSMGGLFHDIGKKELDRALLEKPRKNYSVEEMKLYETHPIRGRDILNQIPNIPTDVIYIAMYHHENMLGSGFPFRVKRDKIQPLARIVGLANTFCNLVIQNPNNIPIPPDQAVQKLLNYHLEELDPIFLKALAKIFKVPLNSKQTDFFNKAS